MRDQEVISTEACELDPEGKKEESQKKAQESAAVSGGSGPMTNAFLGGLLAHTVISAGGGRSSNEQADYISIFAAFDTGIHPLSEAGPAVMRMAEESAEATQALGSETERGITTTAHTVSSVAQPVASALESSAGQAVTDTEIAAKASVTSAQTAINDATETAARAAENLPLLADSVKFTVTSHPLSEAGPAVMRMVKESAGAVQTLGSETGRGIAATAHTLSSVAQPVASALQSTAEQAVTGAEIAARTTTTSAQTAINNAAERGARAAENIPLLTNNVKSTVTSQVNCFSLFCNEFKECCCSACGQMCCECTVDVCMAGC